MEAQLSSRSPLAAALFATLVVAGCGGGGSGPPPAPAATLSSASLSFSQQNPLSTSTAQTVTLTNSGNAALVISAITASGSFHESNNCPTSLAASANCTIQVVFNPSAAGGASGSLQVTDNATGSPQAVALSGTGSGTVTLYVATNGSDSWSGTLATPGAAAGDGPFATLDHARATVQSLDKKGLTQIAVQVRTGTYNLPATIQFTNADLYWRQDGAFATDPKGFQIQTTAATTGASIPCGTDTSLRTFYTFAAWQAPPVNEDAGSVVQAPGFTTKVAYPTDDYSLPGGSPGVGFVVFDTTLPGRTNAVIVPPAIAGTFVTQNYSAASDF